MQRVTTVGAAAAIAVSLAGAGGCGEDGVDDPHAVVEALWQELDARYALFDIRLPDGDWGALGEQAQASVTPGMSADALLDVLVAMIEPLDDGHVQIVADDLGREQDAWVSEYPYYDATYRLEGNAEEHYIDGELSGGAQDQFAWGAIGTIGYVSITSMDELSPSGDEQDDVDAAMAAMDAAFAELSHTAGMIVDVRANEGGWDMVALAIAARFRGPETLAWSEQRRAGPEHDAFTEWTHTLVAASDQDAYDGPVVVLTGGGTFSAAETFVLAMRVRDDVRVLGEPTSGHFSDLEDGTLPNGWEYTYSAERYRAADGEIYEARGVPVDVLVPLDVAALASGTDAMLEAALEQL